MKRGVREPDRAGSQVLAIVQTADERERLRTSAEGEPWKVEFCATVAQAVSLLQSASRFVAVLIDRDVPGIEWEQAVRGLAEAAPYATIMLASAHKQEGLWQRVVENGGHDLLLKPLRTEEVRRAVLHAHWYATTIHPGGAA